MVAVMIAGLFASACEDATAPEQLESLTLTPTATTVAPTGTVQLTATGTRANTAVTILLGETYAVTSGGGTVSAAGLFTAPTTPGTSTITVTCAGRTATATVTVVAGPVATITVTPNPTLQIGATQQFTAVATDAFGNIVQITPVWSTTNPPGTIDAGTGMFTAGNTLGTFTASVRATVGSISGTATVTVIAGPLATIEVTPNPVTLAIGAQQQFTAVGRDAGGNVVPTPNLTWSTTNPPGTISTSAGLFTAGNTIGTFENSVTATSGAVSGSATVTVIAGPLASIEVTPNPILIEGAQQQFTAVGRDAGGNEVPIPNLVWSTTNPPGTIDSGTGLFTAGSTLGTFENSVTATSGTISGSATVTVIAGPLASIVVSPNPVTLGVGTQQQFTAVGRDADGNEVPMPSLVWSTTNPPGTIDAGTGLFTAGNTLGVYDNSVTATSGSISGSATVTVIAGPLAAIVVSPNPVTLETGALQLFTAVGRDAGGNPVPITPVWSTTNPPGTIDSGTGMFTAGGTTGLYVNSVRATQGSVFGTATVTVTAPVIIPPPVPAAGPRMIARVAWTCTDGSIAGDVSTNLTAGEGGSVTQTLCPITGTIDIGSATAKQAYLDFLDAYAVHEATACGVTLTGTLDGINLGPGVYCFDNAAALTGTLTLTGTATDQWLFKIGSAGIPGALTGNSFDVVMAGTASACNVTWWVRQASTMTTSNFQGHILAGAGVSFTGGTYKGNAWSQEDVAVTGTAVTACNAP